MRRPLLVAGLLALLAVAGRAAEPAPGVNLEGIADWAAVLPFADAMKSARAFGPPERPWETPGPADKNGWPTCDAGVVVFADQPSAPGDYELRFLGKANVTVPGATATVEDLRHDHLTTATVRVPQTSRPTSVSATSPARRASSK